MASPRSPTPASRNATPELLTPRSKIKALLATVDSSDDDDNSGSRKAKNTNPKAKSPRSNIIPQEGNDGSDSDSDMPVQMRPRGKLAARMQGPPDSINEPATTNTAETSRDRVRRMLEKEEAQSKEATDTEMADADGAEEEDDEDELPVAPRRLKRRAAQDNAPELSHRSPSPGLFVSSPVRPSPAKAPQNQPESEEDLPAVKSDRFKALVERKRQERLAREAEEEARKAERWAQQEKLASELGELDSGDDAEGITDDEGGRRLTQEARPTRKASKKAMEELNRETQRMARNMQLAHEAKTRKKLSKASLFERFNFRIEGEASPLEPQANSSSRPVTPPTDGDANRDTPPSSPPVGGKQESAQGIEDATARLDDLVVNHDMEDVQQTSPTRLDKGKGPATEVEEPSKPTQTKRRVRVRLPIPARTTTADSEDELEITTTAKDRLNAVFNNVPFRKAQESHSILALRALAHVTSPGKEKKRKNEREGMTPGEFQATLLQKAREQARLERDRRLEMLKAQGIVIQTAEERERQMQEVEDILGKAREEAQRIKEEEAAAEKKEGKEKDEADPLAWDDSEDEEYQDGDADAEGSAVELSGSEEEEEEEEDDDDEESEAEGEAAGLSMFDAEADEADEEEDAASETSNVLPKLDNKEVDDEDEIVEKVTPFKRTRTRNKTAILSDDEGEPTVEATPKSKRAHATPTLDSPAAPTSVLRSAKKTFIPGLPVQGPAGLSLTQIFAGTMDENQKSQLDEPTQSMMPDFDQFPDSNFSAAMDDNTEDMVLDSQQDETQGVTQAVQLNLAQTQMHGLDSLLRDDLNSQVSDMIEPSQDGGLQRYTPLKSRFVEPPTSTVETIPADQHGDAIQSSPLVRRGRLRRKMEMSSINEETAISMTADKEDEELGSSKSAFNVLQKAAADQRKKKLIEEFNKKKSKAKEMVEEQAEESEDEYAGLGGADGEDSDDEFDATVQDIIDDAAGNDADARKLAAFYADRERINDEKEVEKLYKDITSGMLRRKRGADYDLSDSDDGGEARRRMKRRQFAKMQKALFADERVKKMAENPGNQAFLRTMEDQGSDDEMDFLEIVDAPASQGDESQSQSEQPEQEQQQPQVIPDSQPRKPLGSAGDNRAPAHMRRTKDGKKPSNIGEVRETLSDLLEDGRHSSIIPATEIGSDSEDEDARPTSRGNKENHSPASRRSRNVVVDRISLKRNASSGSSSSSNRLAFTTAGGSSSSFKVPASLLRRATTNSSLLSTATTTTSSSSTTTATGGGSGSGFGEEAKIKKGAGKKSGINGFARDNEKLARMQESERRREEKKVRGAESRAGLVGGLLGKGSFE
ncbi:mediator of replication checkpoint protein 1 [Trichoderma asperellum]|uniref:Mediator of replication checkpoint protein 1 n=1 Tax=Trichoderma asperellum TaxID=101201 RepID=A0A6V8QW42_TRIAP|nr:mediator of replication checkpoint protein 1 [Trichoderma asperellum]